MKSKRISPLQLIPISFLLAIAAGTILLMLPFATADGNTTSPLTALFTSTTSVCVTGLVVVDTFSHWSIFGQAVMLTLVQIGGLGVVAVGSMLMLIGKKKFSLGDRILLGNSLNVDRNRGLLGFLVSIFKGVFIAEGIGALLFMIEFIPEFGAAKGIWVSVFQSVSAFCNAGMDVIGPNSLINYNSSPLVMFVTMGLIIIGGLGFVVWFDLYDGLRNAIKRRFSIRQMFSHLSEQSKVVLSVTAALILTGTLCVFAAEYNNPETLGGMSLPEKLLNSMFQSVTFRTAGFASVPQDKLSEVTCLIGDVLMFIGGSPVGTAGGIKTVTFFLFFMNAFSYVGARKENVVFHRRVPNEMMSKASAIVFVSFFTAVVMTVALMSCGGIVLTDAVYEVVSALATVGLSRGLTPNLNSAGRVIIIISMYLGRIGPISMALFFSKGQGVNNKISHSEGTFYVG